MLDLNIYKRLFEVQILHGFHLDNWYTDNQNNLKSFQDYTDAEREFILVNKYNILDDLLIEPTAETAKMLKGNRMPWRILPSGILVGVEVERDAGNTKFFPKIPLNEGARWTFIVKVRNPYYLNITNHTLRPSLPGRYFFTNINTSRNPADSDGKTFPALSRSLPTYNALYTWEMGEIVRIGPQVRQATKTSASLLDFTTVTNWQQYAHSGDRILLPKQFVYRFDPQLAANPISEAVFTLLDKDDNEITKITKDFSGSPVSPNEVSLDFRYLPQPANPTLEDVLHPQAIPDGWYTLKIDIDGALFDEKWLTLRSDLPEDISVLGVIEIVNSSAAQPDFRVLDNDGSLRLTQINDNGAKRWLPPIFEVRLLSRATYWQYTIESTTDLQFADQNLFFPGTQTPTAKYSKDDKRIETIGPRRLFLARKPFQVNTLAGNSFFLPNPDRLELHYSQDTNHKYYYYSELFLSTIKLD